MRFIANWVRRFKLKLLLKKGDNLYKQRHLDYTSTATQEELLKMPVMALRNLRERYNEIRSKSLDMGIFFEGTDPYVIIDSIRYNLADEVLTYPSLDWYSSNDKLERKTLAEIILPRGMVVVRPIQQVILDKDRQMVVSIKPYTNTPFSKFL